jgi:RHS repeat-associated protein
MARVVLVAHALAGLPAELWARDARPPETRVADDAASAVAPYLPVAVNRTIPSLASRAPFTGFSARPSDEEFLQARVFRDALLPVGRTTPADNAAFGRALNAYARGARAEAVDPIRAFLDTHPRSAWRASALLQLGITYRAMGATSKALDALDEAWRGAKDATDRPGRSVAETAAAEWLTLSVALGRTQAVVLRLQEVESRHVSGTAAEMIARARFRLDLAARHPALSVPGEWRAFEHLLPQLRGDEGQSIRQTHPWTPSPRAGARSIGALVREARDAGVALRPTKRAAGAAFVAPALVHFTSGQVVALLRSSGEQHLIYDAALDREIWMSRAVLDGEASGYALLPGFVAARGWMAVSAAAMPLSLTACPPGGPDDGDGQCPWGNPNAPCGAGGCTTGLAAYGFHRSTAGLLLNDVPAGYAPPRGLAIRLGVSYHSHEIHLPATFGFSNLGPKWRFSWLSYVEDYPLTCSSGIGGECYDAQAQVTVRGGGHEAYQYPNASGVFPTHWRSKAVLVRTSTSPLRYERRMNDGTVEIYAQGDGAPSGEPRRVFLTEVIDPQGQTVQLTYDAQLRLVAVTDAIGQVSTLAYEHASDPLKITKVTDPFGRAATFTYTEDGHLASITDVIGLTSAFVYGANDFIMGLTTPYGTTTFRSEYTSGSVNRYIEATDPLGGTERLEYWVEHPTLPATAPTADVPTGLSALNHTLNRYVSLYWDKRATALHPRDPAAAVVTRLLMRASPEYAGVVTASVPRSVKRPLEGRQWYVYPGEPTLGSDMVGSFDQPLTTARVLDDGASQISQATYNAQGKVTSRTDPLGRETSYTYAANGIDLSEVRQTTGSLNDLLASYGGYNAQHLPATTTDAAGQSTTFTYNAAGQPLTVTNAKSETTTYAYDTNGYLQSVTGPVTGATTSYAHDSAGRVRTTTDADGYVLITDYDAFDRPIKTTYPDTTFEQTVYDKLDPVRRRDRLERWTYAFYDPLRRVVATRDPLGRAIQQQWCNCGSLDALIDGKGQKTSWERDLQGRITREVRADGVTATNYAYEPMRGRLRTVTDPKMQVTTSTYNVDDTLHQTAYTNATIATPSVSYTYEAGYNRLATVVDGIGTTTYAYKAAGVLGAGQVASVDGPLTDDTITYTYDELGRVTTRAINGTANQTTQTYDALGRVMNEVNLLGTFTYGYDGVASRLASVTYPSGQTSSYAYYNNVGDHRLQTIHHKLAGGATLSKFDYTYDSTGRILTWRQQADSDSPTTWSYIYDGADQLLTADQSSTGTTPAVLRRYGYTYDLAGNRTTEQVDDAVTLSTYDVLNRLLSHQAGGGLRIAGSVSEPASVTIQGKPAIVTVDGRFSGTIQAVGGTTTFSVEATDASGNARVQKYEFDATAPTQTFAHDPNGNVTTDGSRTFEWDAADRLLAVAQGTLRSEFLYDALSRRVSLRDIDNSTVTRAEQIIWSGSRIVEDRGNDGLHFRRRFGDGEQVDAVGYFLTKDHLGSVREASTGSGSLSTRFAYDPFGRSSALSSTVDGARGFGGYTFHSQSGLLLTWYRAYEPSLGRWLSEDPIRLRGGLNLLAYVGNDPLNAIDPLGLRCYSQVMLVTAYCDRGPGSDWSHYKPNPKLGTPTGSVGPGTVAVANSKQQPYCYGSRFTVAGPNGPDYEGEAHDTGAGWDAAHHNVPPDKWIDIWLPCKEARQWGKQYRTVTVCDCQPSCYM